MKLSNWLLPVVVGLAVFILWWVLEPNQMVDAPVITGWVGVTWLVFRAFGSTFLIPFAEELAFRGYVMRRLVKRDFETVSYRLVSVWGFLGSSLAFGLLHQRWLAGIAAGLAYAFVCYRSGQLRDAVIAHAVTNGLIALAVLGFGKWSFWI